jgi:ABC-type Zn uptake system ZnuABC Zn-binding protein ZnuA
MKQRSGALFVMLWAVVSLGACQPSHTPPPSGANSGAAMRILATMSFLADIAQHVVGDEPRIDSLVPANVDPHGFQPAPADIIKVAQCNVLISNGAGLETFLDDVLQNAGGQRTVIRASQGLVFRTPTQGEAVDTEHEGDPHFWLDPNNVIVYAENIRDGLSKADPSHAEAYRRNADDYIAQLKELDAWIREQVSQVPTERRLLVTNHESLGYFADRYGFRVVGTIIPSVSTESSPSAQQLVGLITQIRATRAPAIFLETGTNPQLADQIASETGVRVITGLYSHSVSAETAPTYLDMMRHNTDLIVQALK